MHSSARIKKRLIAPLTLCTSLLLSCSSYAATQLHNEQYLLDGNLENTILKETFKPYEQKDQTTFDLPNPNLSTIETAPQIKSNYKKVLLLILNKQLQQAKQTVNLLINDHPDQAIYYNLKALLQLIDKDQSAAQQTFRTAIKMNKSNSQAYTALAQIALENKDFSEAEQLANQALKVNPHSANSYKILAKITLQRQGIDATETLLLDALQKMRGYFSAEIIILNELTKVYINKKQPNKLTPLATSLTQRHPGNVSALAYLAGIQLKTKDDSGAEKTLRQIISLQPTNGKFRFLLAKLLAKQGRQEQEVLSLLDKAALSIDNPALVLSFKAKVLISLKQYAQARAIAEKVDQSYPTLSLGKLLKGDIYFSQKEYAQAVKNYQQAYQIKPTTHNLDAILKALLAQNKYKDALALLNQELAKHKNNILIQLRLATLHQSATEYTLAANQYQSILAIQPDNLVALNNLAWIYNEQNNPKSLDLAKQAYTIAPNQGAIADTYGYILLNNGHTSDSITVLIKAAELNPDATDTQLHLAQALIADQQLQKAKVILQALINKDAKEKPAAIKLMQQL